MSVHTNVWPDPTEHVHHLSAQQQARSERNVLRPGNRLSNSIWCLARLYERNIRSLGLREKEAIPARTKATTPPRMKSRYYNSI